MAFRSESVGWSLNENSEGFFCFGRRSGCVMKSGSNSLNFTSFNKYHNLLNPKKKCDVKMSRSKKIVGTKIKINSLNSQWQSWVSITKAIAMNTLTLGTPQYLFLNETLKISQLEGWLDHNEKGEGTWLEGNLALKKYFSLLNHLSTWEWWHSHHHHQVTWSTKCWIKAFLRKAFLSSSSN